MKIKKFEVGPLFVNCYVVYDENSKEAVVIDPGDEPELIVDFINGEKLSVKYIICTHGHFDHIGSVREIKEETNAKVALHKEEIEIYRNSSVVAREFFGIEIDDQPEPDLLLKDEDLITIENLQFKVIHTPGHSPGSISLYCSGYLFTGDTLFAGSVGRTDLIGGNQRQLMNSLRKIATLPMETVILPGHGPQTKLIIEIKSNPFYYEVS